MAKLSTKISEYKKKSKKIFMSEMGARVIIFICAACLILSVSIIANNIHSFFSPDAALYVITDNNTRINVYYLENDIFGSGPISNKLHYLMSFTDYIEIENSFSARFSQDLEVSYQYTAAETLVIKHQKGSDRNINPAVYEEKHILAEINGENTGGEISFKSNSSLDEPGGVYIVDLKKYIEIYHKFVESQSSQIKNNIITEKPPKFSAELLIDFTYYLSDKNYGLNKTFAQGYNIPISNEVFGIDITGASENEISIPLREFKMPGLPLIILLVLWIIMNVFGLSLGIRQLVLEKDMFTRNLKNIFSKYSDEIIILNDPVDLSTHNIIRVPEFNDLLKLAVNSSKLINCCYNDEIAEFYIILDGYAYCNNIQRNC